MNAQEAILAFDGGGLSNTAASLIDNDKAMLSTTVNSSKIAITPRASITRSDFYCNSEINGWVTEENGTKVVNSTDEEWDGTTYYLNGVSLPASSSFTVATPDGTESLVDSALTDSSHTDVTSTYGFSVNENGIVSISGIDYTDGDEVSY